MSTLELSWVAPRWPLPIDDGARQATALLLKHLAELGVHIHLATVVSETPGAQDIEDVIHTLGVKSVTVIRRPTSKPWRHLVHLITRPWIPITIAPFAQGRVAKSLQAFCESHPHRPVVYDGLHGSGWTLSLRKNHRLRLKTVYRAHNVETDIWIRNAQNVSNPFWKWFLFYQSRLVAKLERKTAQAASLVFPVSSNDAAAFNRLQAPQRVKTLPIGMSVATPGASTRTSQNRDLKELLFVGRLDWPPNRDGLKWFLENVWPQAKALSPALHLTVIGSGQAQWLERFKDLEGVEILGRVEHLAPYYERCIASIVPIFYGSGTRVKVIESSLYKRLCISTPLGVEGVGLIAGDTFLEAQDASAWIQTLTTLNVDQALSRGEKAFESVNPRFSPKLIAQRFLEELAEVAWQGSETLGQENI